MVPKSPALYVNVHDSFLVPCVALEPLIVKPLLPFVHKHVPTPDGEVAEVGVIDIGEVEVRVEVFAHGWLVLRVGGWLAQSLFFIYWKELPPVHLIFLIVWKNLYISDI